VTFGITNFYRVGNPLCRHPHYTGLHVGSNGADSKPDHPAS
jgi:hypothetical protein